MAETIVKTFEYKIKHTAKFTKAANETLEMSRFVYNCALEQRIVRYRQGKPIGYFEQSRELTEARELPWVGRHLRTIQQDALERLNEGFLAFFKRAKKGQAPGFPRFKGARSYSTFSMKIEPQRACPLSGDVLKIPGVGSVRIRLSRPIEGTVKMFCEMEKPAPLPETGESVGVDVGLTTFATLSNGETVDNPRHLRRAEKALKRSQRVLSVKKRGSANRAKARKRLSLRNLSIQRARKDFHHKVAVDLVRRFDVIAVEDLQIKNMLKNHSIAKSIADAGWGQFTSILKSKAENAGREFVKVDPRYTSQTCSGCGHIQAMPLALRLYECSNCGLVIHRDHNAAINILGRGAPESKSASAVDVLPASGNRQLSA